MPVGTAVGVRPCRYREWEKSKSTQPTLSWADAPAEQDYPAAASFMRLIAAPALAESLSSLLSRAPLVHEAAKDILRAARLPLLPADDPEVTMCLGLISTILGTASSAQDIGPLSAFGVAAYIAVAGLWSSPVSGASMDPARSLAPVLISPDLHYLWIYLSAPLLGALAAVAAGLGAAGSLVPAAETSTARLRIRRRAG